MGKDISPLSGKQFHFNLAGALTSWDELTPPRW